VGDCHSNSLAHLFCVLHVVQHMFTYIYIYKHVTHNLCLDIYIYIYKHVTYDLCLLAIPVRHVL
jgi:hypothetical protein